MNIDNLLLPPHASVEFPEHAILQSVAGAAMEPPLRTSPQSAVSPQIQQAYHFDYSIQWTRKLTALLRVFRSGYCIFVLGAICNAGLIGHRRGIGVGTAS